MLLVVMMRALLQHQIVEGDKVEHTLLEIDHKEVVVIWFALVLQLVVKVQVN